MNNSGFSTNKKISNGCVDNIINNNIGVPVDNTATMGVSVASPEVSNNTNNMKIISSVDRNASSENSEVSVSQLTENNSVMTVDNICAISENHDHSEIMGTVNPGSRDVTVKNTATSEVCVECPYISNNRDNEIINFSVDSVVSSDNTDVSVNQVCVNNKVMSTVISDVISENCDHSESFNFNVDVNSMDVSAERSEIGNKSPGSGTVFVDNVVNSDVSIACSVKYTNTVNVTIPVDGVVSSESADVSTSHEIVNNNVMSNVKGCDISENHDHSELPKSNNNKAAQSKNGVSLNCIYTNADQLPNKVTELEILLNNDNIDICTITEVFPKCDRLNNKNVKVGEHNEHFHFNIPGYNYLQNPIGRGVCIFMKEDIPFIRQHDLEELFEPSIFGEVKCSNNSSFYSRYCLQITKFRVLCRYQINTSTSNSK